MDNVVDGNANYVALKHQRDSLARRVTELEEAAVAAIRQCILPPGFYVEVESINDKYRTFHGPFVSDIIAAEKIEEWRSTLANSDLSEYVHYTIHHQH
jgi:hypothetical protein